MKVFGLHIVFLLVLSFTATAQKAPMVIHPLSDADIIFGKVAQTKEIFYIEPKAGEKTDTVQKRITWYDEDGNTQNLEKFIRNKTEWTAGPEFAVRLTKFGNPPVTTGKDSLNFSIKYDSLGNEVERKNYTADGMLYSRLSVAYNPDHTYKKSKLFIHENLFSTINYTYEQGRLTKERIVFPNHMSYDITYKYEGVDTFGNWIKRTRTLNAGLKEYRVQVTERRVIYYE